MCKSLDAEVLELVVDDMYLCDQGFALQNWVGVVVALAQGGIQGPALHGGVGDGELPQRYKLGFDRVGP